MRTDKDERQDRQSAVARDPWFRLSRTSPARIALGRSGSALPTREVLSFALDHARARDAVNAKLDREALAGALEHRGLPTVMVESRASDRQQYLRRPDLGRRLDPASIGHLEEAAVPAGYDLCLVLADGLSATAVTANAVELIDALLPSLTRLNVKLAPICICRGARVALGDEIAMTLGAKLVAILIGERPGLSSPDGLSVYLTLNPTPGSTDADRNCISNIWAGGLAPRDAAARLAWLIERARSMGATGVALKDESQGHEALEP